MKRAILMLFCAALLAVPASAQRKAKPSAATPTTQSQDNTQATDTSLAAEQKLNDQKNGSTHSVKSSVTVSGEASLTSRENPAPSSLPVGTAVKMKLEQMVSTHSNNVGDTFTGRVTEDVTYSGKIVIPVGSSIAGRIWKATEPRRIKGVPTLELRPDTVTLPNGEKFQMNATVVDAIGAQGTKVHNEGKITGKGINRRDEVEIGIGAGSGLLIGAIADGAKGGLIGTAIGGGAGVVYWLTKHKSANLPAGTEIVMELSRPMTLNAVGD